MDHSQVKSVEDSEMCPPPHLSFRHKNRHFTCYKKERDKFEALWFSQTGHMITTKEIMRQIKTDDKVVGQQARNGIYSFGLELTKPC